MRHTKVDQHSAGDAVEVHCSLSDYATFTAPESLFEVASKLVRCMRTCHDGLYLWYNRREGRWPATRTVRVAAAAVDMFARAPTGRSCGKVDTFSGRTVTEISK